MLYTNAYTHTHTHIQIPNLIQFILGGNRGYFSDRPTSGPEALRGFPIPHDAIEDTLANVYLRIFSLLATTDTIAHPQCRR